MAERPASAASSSSNSSTPQTSPSLRIQKAATVVVKILEASLNSKVASSVEVTLNSEKKRTKVIESASPAWNETFEFAVSDNKWRLKINIEDSTGASLGVKNVKASEVEGWYNLEDPSSTVRSCGGTINIQVTQRDSIPKTNSHPTERSKSPRDRPVSPVPQKPALTQSNRVRDLSGSLQVSKEPENDLTTSGKRKVHKDKEKKDDKKEDKKEKEKKHKDKEKEKERRERREERRERDKKEKRNSADLSSKKVTLQEPVKSETRPRTLSDTKSPEAINAAASAAASVGPQREAFLAPTLTQKFKSFGRVSPLVHSWELDAAEVEFQDELGEGASAKVFKGQWRGQEVAIKVMKDKIEPKMLEDFKLEFNIMATIRSPNIVFFYGATLSPMLAIVLEFCHKGSLHDAMQAEAEKDSFTWPRSLKILEHALKGIICLHSWKPQIVHRDLKSMNLLVDDNWNVKVGDFGLSRFTGANDQQSTLGKMRGTYAYVAPEVYFGAAFTPKADVYSMAIILWEVVVRTVTKEYTQPYAEYPQIIFPFQIVIQTAKNNLRPTIPETAPASVAALIEASWAKEPEKRPTAQEMLDRVRALMKEYEANKDAWDRGTPTASPKPAETATPGAP